MAVYKIGSTLGDPRAGAIAVVPLLFTPLYFSRSIYATNHLPVAAFLTAALLFFLKGFQAQKMRYWSLFGLLFGFALLTSTHALVFTPSVLILFALSYRWTEKRERKRLLGYWLEAMLLALAIYGIWLLRNTIYVHNPVYHFGSQWFGGLHFDAKLFNRTVSSIRKDSIFNYFGTNSPTLSIYLQRVFFNRSQFPVISILLILGAMVIPFDRNRRGWGLVGLFFLPVGLVFASTWINIFPRYFVLIMPECALIVALLLTKILTWGNFHFVTTGAAGLQNYRSTNTMQGWSQPVLRNGTLARSVAKGTTKPRLFISNSDQINLRVEYLDAGTATVDFNVKKLEGTWDYSTHIVLTNSNRWRTQDLKLPHIAAVEMVEIGIFSPEHDFIVKQLAATGQAALRK